jgi:hypothetical protein
MRGRSSRAGWLTVARISTSAAARYNTGRNDYHPCKALAPWYSQGSASCRSAIEKWTTYRCLFQPLDEVKGISLLLYLLMVRMKLKLIEQRQEPLSLIDNFNWRYNLWSWFLRNEWRNYSANHLEVFPKYVHGVWKDVP